MREGVQGVDEGRFLDANEQWASDFFDKARETIVPTLNDLLGRLATIDAALIGGGFVAAKGDALPYWCAVAVVLLLMGSLLLALRGLYSGWRMIDSSDLEQI